MIALRDPGEGRKRLALRTRGDQDLLVTGQISKGLGIDEQPRRHFEIAQVLGDRHVAHHGPADIAHLATMLGGGIHDLLHPVDV